MKLGMQVRGGVPLRQSVEIACMAERKGFDSVWFSEGYGLNDAVTGMATAALSTSRITVGSAVMVANLRHPVVMGMTSMAISELAPNRFVLGLGIGHHNYLAQFYGVQQYRPVRYMREYIDVVRMVASGEQSSYSGEIFSIPYYMSRTEYEPSQSRLPIYLGVMNEQMLRLAGRFADGVLMPYYPKSHIAWAKTCIAEGAAQAGRDPSEVMVGAIAPIAVSDSAAQAEDAMRRQIAAYCTFSSHSGLLHTMGYGATLDVVAPLVHSGDWSAASRALPASLVHEIGIWGTPATCRESLDSFARAGLDTLGLFAVPLPGRTEVEHHFDVVDAFGR